MKHEKHVTQQFIETHYTCDVGEPHKLLLGMRPIVCPVCERDACARHVKELRHGTLLRVCVCCASDEHAQQYMRLWQEQEHRLTALFTQWKESSRGKEEK